MTAKMNTHRSTQTTLKKAAQFQGIGLHAGKTVRCTIHPAPANHGIVFIRTDLKQPAKIRADISKVVRTDLSTTIGTSDGIVATVEHLMAAFRGLGIDNALVEVNAPEVPIMDGSSREFVHGLLDAGIVDLGVSRKVMRLNRTIGVRAGDKYILAKPADKLSISGVIHFGHRIIGEQKFQFCSNKSFQRELASARTFGFLREVEYLHKKGLALGGSLSNAVVLDENRVLNPEGLRFADEFVRHKVLDALGDFALLGLELQAEIEIFKSGHELHAGFLGKVLEDPSNYKILDLGVKEEQEEASIDLQPMLAAGAY